MSIRRLLRRPAMATDVVSCVDLTRDHSLLTRELLGGVRGFRVDHDGGATGEVRNLLVHRRVPVLALHRELAGASLVLGREHEVLVAPAGPTEGRARLVLVLPTSGEAAAVTPGAPVTLPKGVVAHLRRMLPFYRRRAKADRSRASGEARFSTTSCRRRYGTNRQPIARSGGGSRARSSSRKH